MNKYYRLGRLRMPVAKIIGVQCADIYIDSNHVAAIDLNYSTKKGFRKVKTAQPRRYAEIARKKILWQSCPRSQ